MKTKLNTEQVIGELGKLFCSPAYAMLTQVRNGTGYSREARTADAMFMSLWPSRGIYLAGIEVKVSRTDWLKELKDPKKAEDLAKYCDYWYLAVGDTDIVKEGELPATWGLMAPTSKGGMKIVKEATKLSAEPIDRLFLAAIMRNMTERCVAKDTIVPKMKERYEAGVKDGEYKGERAIKQYADLKKQVDDFTKASGVEMGGWGDHVAIGQAVKDVMNGKDKLIEKKLVLLADRAQKIADYAKGMNISTYDL